MSQGSRRAMNRKRLENALTLLSQGRLTPPYRAPYEVLFEDAYVSLRCYHARPAAAVGRAESEPPVRPILLVPPLMVTSEIYDISPELSAVAYLSRAGVGTYVADFGAPEAREGGLDRTLDDHVLAVSRCIDHLRAATGEDVHLVGYSQGGMFCYQAAAYRKSAGIASVVTFGAPVDILRNVPFKVNDALATRLVSVLRRVADRPLEGMRAIPGTLSSRGFKLLAPLQEVRHLVQLFGVLHDEEALARIEPKRRFLGGEGFIAWPGPALRKFIDEFVVQNRMKQGGFVIAGRTVALADITNPICYLVGEEDDLAQPDAVRAIRHAAARAASYPVHVAAGHFGLVVGRAAMSVCWPTLLAWTAWIDGRGARPEILDTAAHASPREPQGPLGAAFTHAVERVWNRMGELGIALGRTFDRGQLQLPRVLRRGLIGTLGPSAGGAHVSLSRSLREQAAAAPDAVCFLYAGRAYTFADADRRVDAVARSLAREDVGLGRRVGVMVASPIDRVSALMALNRLGAIAIPVDASGEAAVRAHLLAAEASLVLADGARLAAAREAFEGPIARIGPGSEQAPPASEAAAELALSEPGRLHDGALVIAEREGDHALREISNGEWLTRGLDIATKARLTAADTIYCPPLGAHTIAVALAGALVGGARLHLAEGRPGAGAIWDELLNTGASVIIADDDLAHALADAPRTDRHPVRLVLGDHLASEVSAALVDRLGERTRFRIL